MNIQDNPLLIEQAKLANRRQFFGSAATGIGGMALASLLNPSLFDRSIQAQERGVPIQPGAAGILQHQHFPPKAKRIIYLFMSGAPSQ